MSRGKHTEAQIIEALKQVEGGRGAMHPAQATDPKLYRAAHAGSTEPGMGH